MRRLSLCLLLALTGCPDPLATGTQPATTSGSSNNEGGSQTPPQGDDAQGNKRFNCNERDDCVEVSGELVYTGSQTGSIRIDVLINNQNSAPSQGDNLELSGMGPFSFKAPKNVGDLIVEGFIDQAKDGPSQGDPKGSTYIKVDEEPVTGVRVVITDDGKRPEMPGSENPAEGEPTPAPEGTQDANQQAPDAPPQPKASEGQPSDPSVDKSAEEN